VDPLLQYTVDLTECPFQDQAIKAGEADDLEAEVRRLREENAKLRSRADETAAVEAAKAKAESKLEQMEAKVRHIHIMFTFVG
jgi:regulator of replication initiation timing